jgi:hypothetical protein
MGLPFLVVIILGRRDREEASVQEKQRDSSGDSFHEQLRIHFASRATIIIN